MRVNHSCKREEKLHQDVLGLGPKFYAAASSSCLREVFESVCCPVGAAGRCLMPSAN
jgi:hypothetical protein